VEAAPAKAAAVEAAAMEAAAAEPAMQGEGWGRERQRSGCYTRRNGCGFQTANRARHLEFSSDFEFQIRAFAR
jgi:hypothetical protein